jgi:hypothetical protein
MSQEAFNKYAAGVAEGAQPITDSDLVQVQTMRLPAPVPATRSLMERPYGRQHRDVGFRRATGVVSRRRLERYTVRRHLELNARAWHRIPGGIDGAGRGLRGQSDERFCNHHQVASPRAGCLDPAEAGARLRL